VVFGSWFRAGRRKQLLAEPLPDQWRDVLPRNVPLYQLLPPGLQQKLTSAARIIAAERRFVGCKGLTVSEEMKITIAAQAALLVLGEEGYYFDRITSFLLYPYQMVLPPHGVRPSDEEDDFGERIILGQAFQQGEIILSWPDVLHGGRVHDDGENVVLHELAHHLDGLDGQMGGSPPGLASRRQDHFHRVFEQTLGELRRDLADDVDTVLHSPAAESMTELFAYGTEAFFERPAALRQQYPDFFGCLHEFYKLDPRAWFSPVIARPAGRETRRDRSDQDQDEDEDEDSDLPDSPADLPPLTTADEYFARGQELCSQDRWDLAAADFDRCVRMDPSDQEALVWRGRAHLFQQHVEAALADAERACRLDSDDGEAHSLRGMCLAAAGKYDKALAAFAVAGSAVAEDIEAMFARGISHRECGDWNRALSDFCEVIDLDQDDAEAWYQRAVCHQQLGRSEEAERDLAKARELGWSEDGESR
jgi:Mlc titration factor MtfA (ptsG expression regulator)/Tfp pilus assembly protein PilF